MKHLEKGSIKTALLVGLSVMLVTVVGCAAAQKVADSLIGMGDGTGVLGPLLVAGSNLPGWLGWLVGLLGGAAAGYKTYRAKQLGIVNDNYKEAVDALVIGFQRVMEGQLKDKVDPVEIKKILEQAKIELMTNPQFLTDLVALIKGTAK